MKTKFANWHNWVILSGAFFVWACQEPTKEEAKVEESAIEKVKPVEPASAPPVETVKQPEPVNPQPEPVKSQPKPKKETDPEKKPVVKAEKPKKEVEEVVLVADQPAEPISGYPAYYRYIKNTLQYPEEAKKHNAEGQVFVEFVVRKDGSIDDVRVQSGKGIGFGCDEEAVRVVKQGEKWKPAINKGEPVAQRVTLPIKFKLN
ncbi:TonB family protein [Rhodoflexus sp.]